MFISVLTLIARIAINHWTLGKLLTIVKSGYLEGWISRNVK